MKSINFSVFLFFLSLESFYFYSLGVAPVPYFTLFFTLLLSNNFQFRIDKKIFILIISFSCICLFSYFSSLTQLDQSIKTICGVFISLISGLLVYRLPSANNVANGLQYFLTVHALAFYVQVGLMIFDINIDYIQPITGEVQRVGTSTYEIFGRQIYRPAGLFTEPGTFGAHYLPILLLWLLMVNDINSKKWILIVAPIFSLSTLAIIIWACFVPLVLILRRLIKLNLFFILFFGLFLMAFVYLFFDYFMYSLMAKTSIEEIRGNEVRLLFLKEQIYENIDNIFFVGNGFPVNPPVAVNGEDYLLKDQGVFVWMLWTLGVLPSLILLVIINIFIKKKIYLIPLIVLMMSKNPMSYPFSFFVISLIIWSSSNCIHKKY